MLHGTRLELKLNYFQMISIYVCIRNRVCNLNLSPDRQQRTVINHTYDHSNAYRICCHYSEADLLLICRSVRTELFIAFCRSHVLKWMPANAPPATQNQFFLSQLWFLIFSVLKGRCSSGPANASEKVRKEKANV